MKALAQTLAQTLLRKAANSLKPKPKPSYSLKRLSSSDILQLKEAGFHMTQINQANAPSSPRLKPSK